MSYLHRYTFDEPSPYPLRGGYVTDPQKPFALYESRNDGLSLSVVEVGRGWCHATFLVEHYDLAIEMVQRLNMRVLVGKKPTS